MEMWRGVDGFKLMEFPLNLTNVCSVWYNIIVGYPPTLLTEYNFRNILDNFRQILDRQFKERELILRCFIY